MCYKKFILLVVFLTISFFSFSQCLTASDSFYPSTTFTPACSSSCSFQCSSVNIRRIGKPPTGVTFYWQGTNPNGTLTTQGSGTTFSANSSGTYYIRSRNFSGCWSSSSVYKMVNVLGLQNLVVKIQSIGSKTICYNEMLDINIYDS
jgi:hypothetical protein